MTHDEMIAVIQADKARKQIQYRSRNVLEDWHDLTIPIGIRFSFHDYEYRVKPAEAVPHYPALYERGKQIYVSTAQFPSEGKAKAFCRAMPEAKFIRLASEYPPVMIEESNE